MTTAPDVVAFGGVHRDTIGRSCDALVVGTSNPGTVIRRTGGVAFNVAANLGALGASVRLVGAIGADAEGAAIADDLHRRGIGDALIRTSESSGHYVALESGDGGMLAGVSAMPALEALQPSDLDAALADSLGARWWFVDANLSETLLAHIAATPGRPPLAADTVSLAKAERLHACGPALDLVFCNRDEAAALGETVGRARVITDGPRPVTVQTEMDRLVLPVPKRDATTATGAGDALIAGTLAALIGGAPLGDAVRTGIDRAGHVVTAAPA